METTATTETITPPVIPAPKAFDLLKSGWRFAKDRRDLYQWYLLSLLAMSVISSEVAIDFLGQAAFAVISIGALAAFIFTTINSWSIIYAVAQPDITAVTYQQSFGWASGNFFKIAWTSILSTLITFVGFLFFIVPGVMTSVFFIFALYVQANGAKFGPQALKASYRLVKGRWWLVAKKLIAITFLLFLFFIPFAFIYGIGAAFFYNYPLIYLVVDILVSVLAGGVATVVSTYAFGQLFKYLQATR